MLIFINLKIIFEAGGSGQGRFFGARSGWLMDLLRVTISVLGSKNLPGRWPWRGVRDSSPRPITGEQEAVRNRGQNVGFNSTIVA
ncbi:MAG: hypothetical protein P4N24_05790, partial [Acidobacteriota bacterium]|nr:hypothetical protein [Acidobacteriota bacterium]